MRPEGDACCCPRSARSATLTRRRPSSSAAKATQSDGFAGAAAPAHRPAAAAPCPDAARARLEQGCARAARRAGDRAVPLSYNPGAGLLSCRRPRQAHGLHRKRRGRALRLSKSSRRKISPSTGRHTVEFLKIVTEHWPAYLADNRLVSPIARRNALMALEAGGLPCRARRRTGDRRGLDRNGAGNGAAPQDDRLAAERRGGAARSRSLAR